MKDYYRPSNGMLLLVCVALMLLMTGLTGCKRGPKTFPVTGTVMYDGKPLPLGSVTLTPDGTKTSVGAKPSLADVKEGKFSIPKQFGVIGGPYRVFIDATEELPSKNGESGGVRSLFPPYVSSHDFPTSGQEFTIEISIPKQR